MFCKFIHIINSSSFTERQRDRRKTTNCRKRRLFPNPQEEKTHKPYSQRCCERGEKTLREGTAILLSKKGREKPFLATEKPAKKGISTHTQLCCTIKHVLQDYS